MAYDNNFGSNPSPGEEASELSPRDLALLSDYVDRGGAEETSFDDLFDNGMYQTAQTTFQGRSHSLKPHGQTHYRGATEYSSQGMPLRSSTAHWNYLPNGGAQHPSQGHANRHLAYMAARDSARPESTGWDNNFGSNPAPASDQVYHFAG